MVRLARIGATEKQGHGNTDFSAISANKEPLSSAQSVCGELCGDWQSDAASAGQHPATAVGCSHKAPLLFPPWGTHLTAE